MDRLLTDDELVEIEDGYRGISALEVVKYNQDAKTRKSTLEEVINVIPTLSWYSPKGFMVVRIDELLKAIEGLE